GFGSPRERRRHVSRVALRRAGVDPLHDRRDLVVGERSIVLVLADADRLVEMPRWHVARRDALADRPRPRPHVFVGDERHRRRGALVMARLAVLLEDRRHVFRKSRTCDLRLETCDWRHPAFYGDPGLRVRPAAVIAEVAGRLARAI